MFYRLKSDGYWFTFSKRKDSVSLPCYSFIPTSTYPKEWNNRFIFVLASLSQESPPLRDPKAVIDDSVPALSANETVLWKRKYEHPIRAFKFSEGILAMGADCKGVSFVVGGVINPDMGNVLEGKTPDVGSYTATEEVEKTPSSKGGSQRGPRVLRPPPPTVKNISVEEHEDLASHLSQKHKAGLETGPNVVIPEPRNTRLRLRSASAQKSLPASRAVSEVPPTNTKGSLSNHFKTLRPSSSIVSEPFLVSSSCPFLLSPSLRASVPYPFFCI
ncbi:hypothetical protein Hanom_Chr15g01391231 [Helianthus anomalus]